MEKEFDIRKETLKTNLLGQILVKKGLINKEQLQEALNIQKKKKGLLGDILIELGYISDEKLGLALASQTDLVYVPVEKYKISKEILRLIPKDVLYKYCFVPLEKINGVLAIAMANPFDKENIKKIEVLTRYRVVCMIGAKTQIEKAIETQY